ncbi:MAG TPA: hypothetical protein VGE52_13610 [Pirellulales bacterium]
MPLLSTLEQSFRNPAFWSDLFGEGIYGGTYGELVDVDAESEFRIQFSFPVSERFGLSLTTTEWLGGFFLTLHSAEADRKTTLACDALDGHPFSAALHWREAIAISRRLALSDPSWTHPGPALLMLSLATPITSDDDAALAFPHMRRAWQSLGLFSEKRIDRLIRSGDLRGRGAEWRAHPKYGAIMHNARSLRCLDLDQSRFPFEDWNMFLAELDFESLSDWEASRASDEERGGSRVEVVNRFELQVPQGADPTLVAKLRCALVESGVGRLDWHGGVLYPSSVSASSGDGYTMLLFGDEREATRFLMALLEETKVPKSVGVYSYATRSHVY